MGEDVGGLRPPMVTMNEDKNEDNVRTMRQERERIAREDSKVRRQ